ncbi:MAG: hypothetical protein R6V15_14090 [Desulfotignum sp.]
MELNPVHHPFLVNAIISSVVILTVTTPLSLRADTRALAARIYQAIKRFPGLS